MSSQKGYINKVIEIVKKRNPGELEFHQAVGEVRESLECVIAKHPEFADAAEGKGVTEGKGVKSVFLTLDLFEPL